MGSSPQALAAVGVRRRRQLGEALPRAACEVLVWRLPWPVCLTETLTTPCGQGLPHATAQPGWELSRRPMDAARLAESPCPPPVSPALPLAPPQPPLPDLLACSPQAHSPLRPRTRSGSAGEIRVASEGQLGQPESRLSSAGKVDKDPGWEMDTQLQGTEDRPPPRSPAPCSRGPGMLAWLSSEERPDGSSDAPAQTPSRLLGYKVAWGSQRVS